MGMIERNFDGWMSFLTKPARSTEETQDLATCSAAVEIHRRTISCVTILMPCGPEWKHYAILKYKNDAESLLGPRYYLSHSRQLNGFTHVNSTKPNQIAT